MATAASCTRQAGESHADVINLVGHLHEYQDKVEAVTQSQTQLLESIESVQNGTRWLLDLKINAQSFHAFFPTLSRIGSDLDVVYPLESRTGASTAGCSTIRGIEVFR